MPITFEKRYPLSANEEKSFAEKGKNTIPKIKKTTHHCKSKKISPVAI